MLATIRNVRTSKSATRVCFLVAIFCAIAIQSVSGADKADAVTKAEPSASKLAAIFAGGVPANVGELRAMQDHTRKLAEQVSAATVAIQVGAAQGSGVIISPDGYVLTAAHVIGKSGRGASIYLRDGRRVLGTTLGSFRTLDAGLLKLEGPPSPELAQEGSWPHVRMGDSAGIGLGQWCLAVGHPGGIQNGREPSVRLGRILTINEGVSLTTDCTLIGGDSGGPLFNMQGNVVAIHSRIGGQLTANLHVPINAFRESWDRMQKGETWGHTPGNQPFLGVQGENESKVAKISRVFPESPAAQAGVREGDIVVKFAGSIVGDFDTLRSYVEEQEPGTKVAVEVLRGDNRISLDVVVGRMRE